MESKRDVLIDAYNYIDSLKKAIEDLSNEINSGNDEKGIKLIPSISDGLDWLIQVINLTAKEHIGEDFIKNLNEKLEEIIEAMNNEDYILVGDLFNYEMIPILDDVKNNVGKLVNS